MALDRAMFRACLRNHKSKFQRNKLLRDVWTAPRTHSRCPRGGRASRCQRGAAPRVCSRHGAVRPQRQEKAACGEEKTSPSEPAARRPRPSARAHSGVQRRKLAKKVAPPGEPRQTPSGTRNTLAVAAGDTSAERSPKGTETDSSETERLPGSWGLRAANEHVVRVPKGQERAKRKGQGKATGFYSSSNM